MSWHQVDGGTRYAKHFKSGFQIDGKFSDSQNDSTWGLTTYSTPEEARQAGENGSVKES